jgi:hypothetical protein
MIAQLKAWFDRKLEDEVMNEKQLANRLRDIANNAADADVELRMLADELDPPKPEPGKSIWFQQRIGGPWEFGISHIDADYSDDEVILVSANDGFTFEQIHTWKPARVLGPRQVAVDVLPVEEWPRNATYIGVYYENDSGLISPICDIPRTEAERMEASDDYE